ncbi:MAG: glycosyltransferase [Verrucomicrobia bacterium]|nr:glycosyltransferase [Verrucomicrobiota bacterium]
MKTIGIFTFLPKGVKPWDPDSIKTGITGSEEAVIYASEELVKHGYRVIIFGVPPENSPHSHPSANPRYVSMNIQESIYIDIAIAWRSPGAGPQLRRFAKKVYLWPHDIVNQRVPDSVAQTFDDVLWLSKFQRAQWVSVCSGFAKFNNIYGNGINANSFKEIQERPNPYSCIYGSNYGQGLEYLLDLWPKVKQEFPRATLDIYYGWEHWGFLTPSQEAKVRKLVKEYTILDVKEHGLVSHEEVNDAYQRSSFWTYPLKFHETFCITALRAQFAGAIPVARAVTGLSESMQHGYKCSTQEEFPSTLFRALKGAEKVTLEDRRKMREFILRDYTWERVTAKWKTHFEKP